MAIVDTKTLELPTDPVLRKKLTDAIQELNDSFVRQDAERELQKDIVATAAESTGVKKADIKKLAKMKYKGDKDKILAQTDALTSAYEVLFEKTVTISASVVASSPDPIDEDGVLDEAWPFVPNGGQ